MNVEMVKARIMERHAATVAKAKALFPQFGGDVPVYFFETGRTAGLAHSDGRVGYNTHIFAQDMERFLADTVPHEVAHVVCLTLRLDNGHGANWKRVCRLLGGSAARCYSGEGIEHKMLRKRKRYEYRASCGTSVMVSDVMHGKIQRGARCYRLRSTSGQLLAEGFTGKTD